MRFVLASYGTRGDVEPSAAVGRELMRRGHDVALAVPPELVNFVESTGLGAVSCGPKIDEFLDEDFLRNMWTEFLRKAWTVRGATRLVGKVWEPIIRHWDDVSATLMSLANGADLLSSGLNFEQAAANVAEYHHIPFAALHHFPMRPNGQLIPTLPSPLVRSGAKLVEWLFWRSTKEVEDAQRRELGLSKATSPSSRRIAECGSLEIQAYDEVCFPGLAAEWRKWGDRRPFVGALTMELSTGTDDDVASWITAGTPPICFGAGSIPLESPAATIELISSACAELGRRAVVCAGGSDISDLPHFDNLKVVGPVNYATVFPACRAVVHHGGSGTTAASLRAGVPTLILWSSADQPYWGAQVKRLKVGTARRFSATTRESLVADLGRVLDPQYAVRARDLATKMTKPRASVSRAADLLEQAVRPKTSG